MIRVILISGILAFSLLSCTSNKEKSSGEAEMYEASELALLMRSMAAEQDSFKSALLRGDSILTFPSSYIHLLDAQASEGMHIGDEYKAFAHSFIDEMDSLRVDTLNTIKRHNRIVEACIACHEMHCGGPIDRIENLFIHK